MINFNKIMLEDKEWVRDLLKESDYSGCHQNFGNLFAWSSVYNTHVARVNDLLVVKESIKGKDLFFYPAGRGDKRPALEKIMEYAEARGQKCKLTGLSPENMKELDALFPDVFTYKEVRDAFDYVYLLEKMADLKGKKLHGKRNHINAFIRNNPNWSFETITGDNLEECGLMNKKWCLEIGCKEDIDLYNENCATKVFLKNFSNLGLDGGLIRVEGEVIAYTLGEVLNSDTYVIHIEKALKSIQGAYTMINREFAQWVQSKYPHLTFINREEDMGLDGLRKAKKSYYPVKMEEKYLAVKH